MRTWIVSSLIIGGIWNAQANGLPEPRQQELNPPIKIALYEFNQANDKYEWGPSSVTKNSFSSTGLRCEEFQYLKGLCRKVNSFLERQEIK